MKVEKQKKPFLRRVLMLRKFFQWLPLLALSSAVFAAPESNEEIAAGPRFAARQNMQQGNGQSGQGCGSPCAPCEPCKPCVPCTPPNRNITPPVRCCGDNMGAIVTADFLYWRADENDLPYGFVNNSAVATNNDGSVAHINYKWKPGFRVGLGWDTPWDGWDWYFNWTWFRDKSSSSVSVTTPTAVTGVDAYWINDTARLNAGTLPIVASSAQGNWRLLMNMIDMELGRDFAVSCGLALRPFFGARGGWINRKFSTNYAVNALDLSTPASYSSKVNQWGVGPRAGLNTTWSFACSGFQLYGNLATALLYGKVNKTQVSISQGTPNIVSGSFSNRQHVWRAIPNVQMFLGLGWGTCFNCNKMYFAAKVGWESNYYWNMQNFAWGSIGTAPTVLGGSHALSLNGLTVDFKFDF
jgi:hypothetical protein